MNVQEDRKRSLAEGRGRVPPRYLAHIVRRTARFKELVRWYSTVLGAEVVHSNGMLAFLTYDDEHHRIAIVGIPGLPEQPAMAAGTDHIAFTYANLGAPRDSKLAFIPGGSAGIGAPAAGAASLRQCK